MKETGLSVGEFTMRYVPRVRCITLLHYHLIGTQKLEEVGSVTRVRLDGAEEASALGDLKLVWYRNERGERVFWNEKNAVPYTVRELVASYAAAGGVTDTGVRGMIESFRGGLISGVEMVVVHDTLLKESIVVDGVIRAAALYYLFENERETLDRLFASPQHEVALVKFTSPAGAMLFPCDFINICRDYKARHTG